MHCVGLPEVGLTMVPRVVIYSFEGQGPTVKRVENSWSVLGVSVVWMMGHKLS